MVIRYVLNEIGEPTLEIFPKHDALDTNTQYGNFINAPLFGALVKQGKTVFVDVMSFTPYPDQWTLLESVSRLGERDLDEIIEVNNLSLPPKYRDPKDAPAERTARYGLPVCAQKILRDGVSQYQRVACFRVAVHLNRLGLPFDVAVAALKTWALKNKPANGKEIIRNWEVISQTSSAYNRPYAGFGCDSEAIRPFCEPSCPVRQWRERSETVPSRKADCKERRI